MSLDISSTHVNAFRAGHVPAFEHIYKQLRPWLKFFALRFIDDEQEAEDIAGNTLLKMWNLRDKPESANSLVLFAQIATRNACFDFIRSQKRGETALKHLSINIDQEEQFNLLEEVYLVETNRFSWLVNEIQKLDGTCGEVMRSLFLEGRSIVETAGLLGISRPQVDTQKARGVKKLLARFEEDKHIHNIPEILFYILLYLYLPGCMPPPRHFS